MDKKCQCKKTLDIFHFMDYGKELSKCNICRMKTSKPKNICQICGVRARYNYKGETDGVRCVKHKEPDMIDIKANKCKKCSQPYPLFNFAGETKGIYCSKCKEPEMIDVRHKKCIVCNIKDPRYNIAGETKNLYCYICKLPDMINIMDKKCINCKNYRAIYNEKGQTKGLFCKECKTSEMINVTSKKCIKCGEGRPFYNMENEEKALFCSKCKTDDMKNVSNKKCMKCNNKIPSYNYKGEKIPLYCMTCKSPEMVNVKHKKCVSCCERIPIFNYTGEKKGLYCLECKLPEMIDVRHDKCIKCNDKRRNYNYEGESEALYCVTCKLSDMVDVNKNTCHISGCRKRGYYEMPGVLPKYCKDHRTNGMIKNPRKTCEIKNCKQTATHGILKNIHCETHAHDDEYNLSERKCSKCGNIDILNKQGICVNTCSLLEIDNIVKKHNKKKEEYVGKLLKEHINMHNILFFTHDETIDAECTKKRPDFVLHCGTHVVIIEVDEEQHKSYKNCGNTKEEKFNTENRRMYDIAQAYIGLPVIFIRYNPDNYSDVRGKKGVIINTKRHDLLIKWVKKCINNDLASSSNQVISNLRVKYLFYDGFDETDGNFVNISEKDVL